MDVDADFNRCPMSEVVENISELCAIKKADFDGIFDDFFLKRNLDIEALVNLGDGSCYQNCEILKIEIKS